MFGLSITEVMIILAVALIFVGPDQLPKVARQIAKGVRQVQSAVGKVDGEMRKAVREAQADLDDDGEPIEPRATPPKQATPPTAAPERDWSQLGKTEVPGRIATATAGRPANPDPTATAPANPDPTMPST